MEDIDYLLFDADNHYYEAPDAFTRFIEPKHRDKAVRVAPAEDGGVRILIGDKPFTFLENWRFDRHAAPGSLRDLLRQMSSGAVSGSGGVEQPMDPAWVSRDARLALMNDQGIESCFVLPTLAVCVETS